MNVIEGVFSDALLALRRKLLVLRMLNVVFIPLQGYLICSVELYAPAVSFCRL